MEVFAGVLIVVLSIPCWGGQVVALVSPTTAQRWKLSEAPESVDPVFHADGRGEAAWDAFTLWTMPLAGLLLILGAEAWQFVGLIAGGMYVYFGGRGIAARRAISAAGHRIGVPGDLATAYLALAVWALLGAAVIVGAGVAIV